MGRFSALLGCGAVLAASIAASAQVAPNPPVAPAPARRTGPPEIGWSPKKTPYNPYVAPNKPWTKLSEVLAAHHGQATWVQPVIRNKDLMADWHGMAPGGRTPSLEYPDNRTGIIVWAGRLKVDIKGQPPFEASKGFQIDVPFRLPFTLEAVGGEPALWFEVHAAGDLPVYPIETTPDKPRDPPGFVYQKTILAGGDGRYDEHNAPFLDFYKDVIGGGAKAGAFISGDHFFMNDIRGRATPTPPPTDLGHFHFGHDEFWFVMEGNIDMQIEGVPFFTASAGDIILAAQGRWHRASFGGPVGQMDTRVAINPYPYALHNYTVQSGGHQ